MKILVYEWANYMAQTFRDICDEYNISYDSFTWDFEAKGETKEDEEFTHYFESHFLNTEYDFVISINYRPLIADLCRKHGIKYVAWCCDCPLSVSEDDNTMFFDTNYIFLFDRKQYEHYRNKGIETVYHLPLGANSAAVKRFKYDPETARQYMAEVSFVGRLYESQLGLITSCLDAEATSLLTEIVNKQEDLYNCNIINACVTDGLIDYMNNCYRNNPYLAGRTFEVNKPAVRFALSSEATRRNRLVLLSLLSRRYDTKLYSTHIFPDIANVKQQGSVMYETQMPYVFHYSKININPSLRCIETGVPLRAFDIMGYGGFLLSNYQEELADMYRDGEELALYNSYEDAVAKAEFYMRNDSLREKIAQKGYERTMENYTLQHAFLKILNCVCGD